MKMKTLVVFYSRTGNTRKVGQEIAEALGADVQEIKEAADRSGFWGWMKAGRDAMSKRKAELIGNGKDPSAYGLVVIGTPIWAANLTPAVRTWVEANSGKMEKFAAFCTCGGNGWEGNFSEMEKLIGKKPAATLAVFEREIKGGEYTAKIKEFCGKLDK